MNSVTSMLAPMASKNFGTSALPLWMPCQGAIDEAGSDAQSTSSAHLVEDRCDVAAAEGLVDLLDGLDLGVGHCELLLALSDTEHSL